MFQETLFHYLFNEERFYSTVYPFLHKDLFDDSQEFRLLYDKVKEFTEKFSSQPILKDIELLIYQDHTIDEKDSKLLVKKLRKIAGEKDVASIDLALTETEKWIKEKTLYNAIMSSAQELDKKEVDYTQVNARIEEAISVSFKEDLGLNYMFGAQDQYDFYTAEDEVMKCSVQAINDTFGGGLRRKTIVAYIGRTNIGKSLYLTHLASDYLKCGYNVLYVSAEMGARELYKRIDANVLNLQMDDLAKELPKTTYMDKVKHFAKRHKDSMGKLWIKEYPTGEANKLHIKSYLKDLKLKKQFTPDIVILDYLNIFSSCRLNKTSAENSYGYIKSITEEFRAMAIEENCAVVTATQTNRCFSLDTKVETKSGEKIELRDINVGDEIKNNQGFVTVEKKYPTTHQQIYRITTKSGKSVICSEKHIFPTKEHPEGVSLETGLKLGDNFII